MVGIVDGHDAGAVDAGEEASLLAAELAGADDTVVDSHGVRYSLLLDRALGQARSDVFLPVTLTLTVAQAGSSVFLAQLEAVDSMCSPSEEQVDAVAYPNSLTCSPGTVEDPNTAVWLIKRRGRQLTGTIGVSDADGLDATAQVQITGDGKPLAQVSASYAAPAPIDLDISGVLRLEISVVSGETRSRAVLGDMILKGSTADIDTLETDS